MKKIILFFGFHITLLVASSIYATPIATVTENDYLITGTTASELRAQMKQLGPGDNGGHYDAYTKYYVKWRYGLEEENDQCHLANIQVTIQTSFTFPRWKNYADATPAMQSKWDQYLTNLKHHEQGHADNGMDAANEIENMLSALPAMDRCDALRQEADSKAYGILSSYQQKDVNYDEETHHGETQGVVLGD